MPFKSEAQRRKFGELVKQGKMKQSEFDKWNKETGAARLPERVASKTTNAKTRTGQKQPSKSGRR